MKFCKANVNFEHEAKNIFANSICAHKYLPLQCTEIALYAEQVFEKN